MRESQGRQPTLVTPHLSPFTMYPHRIRLRGPWECEPLAWSAGPPGRALPSPCRITLPCRWAEGGRPDFSGRVRFRRRFGYPGQVDDFERVWLTFDGINAVAAFWLNEHFLGRSEETNGSFEFDVTDLLHRRNELSVEVEVPPRGGGLWDEVALEVRCTAFLRAVRARLEGGERAILHVSGEVVGTSERPLELYVLLDGSTVIYRTLEPTPEGQPFQLCSGELNPLRGRPLDGETDVPHRVRVELVNGAVVWYTVEQALQSGGAAWKSTP